MSRHDFSAVVAALEAAAAERRAALDLVVAASDRVSKVVDVQARIAEAPSRVATLVGHGKRALWFATALSVTLIAGSIATKIAQPAFPGPTTPAKPTAPIPSSPSSVPDLQSLPEPGSAPDVVTNYSIFRKRTVNGVPLVAGHDYLKSSDQIWDYAWCYTYLPGPNRETIEIVLASREAPNSPITYPQDPPGWTAVKMNAEIARVLGESCPWIEPYGA